MRQLGEGGVDGQEAHRGTGGIPDVQYTVVQRCNRAALSHPSDMSTALASTLTDPGLRSCPAAKGILGCIKKDPSTFKEEGENALEKCRSLAPHPKRPIIADRCQSGQSGDIFGLM